MVETDPALFRNPHSLANKLGRVLWSIVYYLLFRPTPFFMGAWRRLLLRGFGAHIGQAWLHQSTRIWAPWLLKIGDDVYIDAHVRLYSAYRIEIGDRVIISQNSFLCTASHDYTHPTYPLIGGTIRIGNDTWIAADVFVAPGVTVGEGAVVGARAVAVKDVPAWAVVVGNPARVVKNRERASADQETE